MATWVSSNCTFMELKCLSTPRLTCTVVSSNCTFMELKWQSTTHSLKPSPFKLYLYGIEINFQVLLQKRLERSNCTFMELKQSELAAPLSPEVGSNCTFMELKQWSMVEFCLLNLFKLYLYGIEIREPSWRDVRREVQIVPLWN